MRENLSGAQSSETGDEIQDGEPKPYSPAKHATGRVHDRVGPPEERNSVWHQHCLSNHPVGERNTKEKVDACDAVYERPTAVRH